MTECCLVNMVDRQISAAHAHASTLRRGLPSASLLWLKAIAMQAELWQWMEGQTFTAASAFHSSLQSGAGAGGDVPLAVQQGAVQIQRDQTDGGKFLWHDVLLL